MPKISNMNKLYKILLGAVLLAGCTASETENANAILNDARQALAQNNFDEARTLIDSLRTTYPKEIDVRRAALAFADSIELASAEHELAIADSTNTFVSFELEDMKKRFVFEKEAKYQTTGYYVTPQYAGSKTGLSFYPEVEENGKMLLVSIDSNRKYNFTEVPIDDSAATLKLYSQYNLTDKQHEAIQACEALAQLIAKHNSLSQQKAKLQLKLRFYQKKLQSPQ